MKKYTLKVTHDSKLLKYIDQNINGYKYSSYEKALRKKDILVNGVRVKQNIIVSAGDSIDIFLEDIKVQPFKIFYEDKNIIVFNKGKGVEVCDGDYNIKNEYYNSTGNQIYPVHRIDRNTIGLVLFAKNENTQNKMVDIFKNHYSIKHYYAVVSGEPKNKSVTMSAFLLKDSKQKLVKIFSNKVGGSVKIETNYTVIKQKEDLSLLDVQITAGKTHQIRAHLSYSNLPIVGDEKYGDTKINKLYKQKTQLLQAYKIVFNIPVQNDMYYLNEIQFKIPCEIDKIM